MAQQSRCEVISRERVCGPLLTETNCGFYVHEVRYLTIAGFVGKEDGSVLSVRIAASSQPGHPAAFWLNKCCLSNLCLELRHYLLSDRYWMCCVRDKDVGGL